MKRLLSFLWVVLMGAGSAWADNELFPGLGGEGTEYDPLRINSIADFRVLADVVNGGYTCSGVYFVMEKDVDFASAAKLDDGSGGNFVGIGIVRGYGAKPFSGHFDGQGHAIRNLHVIKYFPIENGVSSISDYGGLFGKLENANVKDIVFDESCRFTSGNLVGSVAAWVYNSTVSGIRSAATVEGGGSKGAVGGIAGLLGYDGIYSATNRVDNDGVLTHCTFTGTVKGSYRIGGIVGVATGLEICPTVSDCVNEGAVTGDCAEVGGIASIVSNATVTRCTNKGTVVGSALVGATYGRQENTGGIAGQFLGGEVSYCTNEGPVKGNGATGGIIGIQGDYWSSSDSPVTDHCTNTATVEGMGGIAGTMISGLISNCLNSGDVIVQGYNNGNGGGAIVGCWCEQANTLSENHYTQNATASYYDEYTGEAILVDGLASRGMGNYSTYGDVTDNNGAMIQMPLVIEGLEAEGSYWATFYRRCGTFKADAGTIVYAANVVDWQGTRKLELTEVADRIVKAGQAVILRSRKPVITLTLTAETPDDSYYANNRLQGTDTQKKLATGDYFAMNTDNGLKFTKRSNAPYVNNIAYFTASSDTPFTVDVPDVEWPAELKGDVNGDGDVDIADVVAVYNIMAGQNPQQFNGDVNQDGATDIADVVAIYNIMAGSKL